MFNSATVIEPRAHSHIFKTSRPLWACYCFSSSINGLPPLVPAMYGTAWPVLWKTRTGSILEISLLFQIWHCIFDQNYFIYSPATCFSYSKWPVSRERSVCELKSFETQNLFDSWKPAPKVCLLCLFKVVKCSWKVFQRKPHSCLSSLGLLNTRDPQLLAQLWTSLTAHAEHADF